MIKKVLISISILGALAACTSDKEKPAGSITNFKDFRNEFTAPSKEFGTAPLYVWNTEITEELIDRTMLDLKEKGFGGVFVHPRPGLVNEYISDNWFHLFKHTVNKGKELGMNVWIYDENSFPSGFAGGHVNAQMPTSYNQGQSLKMNKTEAVPIDTECYLYLKEENGKFINITNSLEDEKGKKGNYYAFSKGYEPLSPWHGGFSYVDILYPGVTEKFLEITGKGYGKAVGDEFGKAIPGWFSDEPHIAPPDGGMRWTPDLFDEFQKKWGYDLRLHLPSIFTEVGDWKQVRHNYFQTLLQMFIDRWAKPCFEYCESKNLKLTGHYWEHIWPEMTFGGDNMAMYAWQQMPGIDMLFNQFDEVSPQAQFGNVRSVKELSSVANQMGYKRTLCETYGAGGWEETFSDFKRLGDWQTALGVNFMNQHLSHLSIAGDRKYDCPTSFSEHSPWWAYYKTLNMHFSRLSMAMSSGEQINDILILEPNSTLWFYYVTWNSSPKLWEVGRNFQSFVTVLEKSQIEYDLGSENIIKDHGKISGNKFEVGKRKYSKVVIPPLTENLDSATFDLIKQFIKNGGTLLAFSIPDRIDGKQSSEIADLFTNNKNVILIDQLSPEVINSHFLSSDIVFSNIAGGNLFHHRRIMDDGQVLLLVNSSSTETVSGQVTLRAKGVVELNTFTAEINAYPKTTEGENITLNFQLPPAGNLLLYSFDSRQNEFPAIQTVTEFNPVASSSPLTIMPADDNVLAIDFCDLQIGNKKHADMHVFEAAKEVYIQHGFKDGNPWGVAIQYKDNIVSRDTFSSGGFEATYKFLIDADFDRTTMKAVVEKANLYTIMVNGKEVTANKNGWWLDRDFKVIDIGEVVKKGTNTLSIKVSPMKLHAEIAPIYILGNFTLASTDKGWAIKAPLKNLDVGSWKKQGWPFYSKSVNYSKKFNLTDISIPYQIQLNSWKGTVAEVLVNGQSAGIIAFEPYRLDVSKFIKMGENTIEVKVVGSNKNIFGPFHKEPELGFVFPPHFRDIKRYPKGSEYQQLDYGLMEEFSLFSGK